MRGSEDVRVALVSNGIPPAQTGYHLILEQLLGAIPVNQIATLGPGSGWGLRPRGPFPARNSGPNRLESIPTAALVATAEVLAPPVLARMFPNVRRIFAPMDPALGVAVTWAKAAGAELWIYAIDLHGHGYWAAGRFLQAHFLARRAEAFEYASRVFALSEGMADWLRSIGVVQPIEILPPLLPVGDRQPLPEGPLTFLMSGAVYSVNALPLRWIEQAVKALAPSAKLRLLTHHRPDRLAAAGLDLTRWSLSSVASADVPKEVARATWTIVGMDSGTPDEALRVAWPTKLREYLSVGRPVLCVSRPEYSVARLVASEPWGIVASTEAETRAAITRIVAEPRSETEARSRAAHEFARARIDDATIGAAFRRDLCA